MTIVLTLENGQSTTTNVAPTFTKQMIDECFLGQDFRGYGIVVKCEYSNCNVY